MIAQHTLHVARVLVDADHDINYMQSLPLVAGLFMLMQHDMLTPSDGTLWPISVITTSGGFGPSTLLFFIVLHAPIIHGHHFFHT
jgi:hypothetical protein